MRSINGGQSLFMVYIIFLLVSFSVMQTNHALRLVKEGDAAIRESHGDGDEKRVNVSPGSQCSKESILVNQGPSGTLPNGIPTYTVIIENVCMAHSCSRIHFHCGAFASARLINPKIFKRLSINDCLVNDGAPLKSSGTLSFTYANTFSYPLSVSSTACEI